MRALLSARMVRFGIVGTAMTGLHLVLFSLLVPLTTPELANGAAFLVATQVNFVVSYLWTWSSRRPLGQETVGYVLRRAVLFTGAAVVGFGVNAVAFSLAYRLLGFEPLVSAVVATGASATATFLLGARVVFRGPVSAVPVPLAEEIPPLHAAVLPLRVDSRTPA